MLRELTYNDKVKIENLFASRLGLGSVGVNWTAETIIKDVSNGTQSLALFEASNGKINALVLFKIMGTVIEVLLIYSRKGSVRAGEELMKALFAAHSQATDVWLEVHQNNQAAITFYERLGFTATSTRRGYYPDGKWAINYNLTIVDGRRPS